MLKIAEILLPFLNWIVFNSCVQQEGNRQRKINKDCTGFLINADLVTPMWFLFIFLWPIIWSINRLFPTSQWVKLIKQINQFLANNHLFTIQSSNGPFSCILGGISIQFIAIIPHIWEKRYNQLQTCT